MYGKKKTIPEAPQEDPRRAYASQEAELVKREGQAIALAKQLFGVGTMTGGGDSARVRDALSKGELTPAQLASDLDVIIKKRGAPGPGQMDVEDFAKLRNELGRLVEERAKLNQQAVPAPRPQASHEQLTKDSEDALKKAQSLEAEASGLGVLSREQKIKEAQNLRSQSAALMPKQEDKPKGKLTYAEENADPNLPPTSLTPVESEFKALGVKREKLVNDFMEILKGLGVDEGEWDDQVPTQAGLKRILSVLDPEGSFAAKLASDIVAEKGRNQAQEADEFAAAQKESDGRATRLDSQLRQQRSELKELYQSLNSQPFMQSWPGLIIYVVLGMLTGPTNAAKLLGIGRNRNAIMGEIESIKEEMRYTNQQMNREEERSFQLRKEAIARVQREREYKRSKDDSLNRMYINHKLILERAKRSAAPQNKAIVSKLEGDFNRTLKFMADAEQIMNNDWLDERDPKKIKASREYDRYRQEAEFIDQKLRALTEQLSPGTYSSEEEEAQTP